MSPLSNTPVPNSGSNTIVELLTSQPSTVPNNTDATAPARVLAEFAKKAPNLEIKAGVVEGTFYDANGMKAIASIPSREVLVSKLLGSLQSPITNLARVLNQIAEKDGAPAEAAQEAPAEETAE